MNGQRLGTVLPDKSRRNDGIHYQSQPLKSLKTWHKRIKITAYTVCFDLQTTDAVTGPANKWHSCQTVCMLACLHIFILNLQLFTACELILRKLHKRESGEGRYTQFLSCKKKL